MNQLSKRNWESFNFKRIKEVLNLAGQTPVAKGDNQKNYMVFDFDETCLMGDIEDHFFLFQLEGLHYQMSPQQFKNLIKLDQEFYRPCLQEVNKVGLPDLVTDLIEAYAYLYDHFIKDRPDRTLEYLKALPIYQSFRAKAMVYYQAIHRMLKPLPGQNYPTYWFAGFTQNQIQALCQQMLTWAGFYDAQPQAKAMTYQTHPAWLGQSGAVQASFVKGLAPYPEIADLMAWAKQKQIDSFIVSASPACLVASIASLPPYALQTDYIFGMAHTWQGDRVLSKIEEDQPLTYQAGKSQVIQDYIAPDYQGQGPLAVFGDSMGDYHMLTHFADTQVSLLMNRDLLDQTQTLVARARQQYGQAQARYLLQGRDQEKRRLRPSQETIGD